MGVVYRARQRGLNRFVALKMIRDARWANPSDVQRFRHEAELAAQLDHPDIVPIHDVGEHEGTLYFTMKLIEGTSLAQAIAGGQWPAKDRTGERRAAALMARVARAVHHAHERGILHRDLKPSNVLMDKNGEPRVIDLGLAKRLPGPGSAAPGVADQAPDAELTRSGAILGAPAFLAPEQASGARGAVTTATDVYGLGGILALRRMAPGRIVSAAAHRHG
jgi:serine/threonine-protein kinase